jgi:hypothetical protein
MSVHLLVQCPDKVFYLKLYGMNAPVAQSTRSQREANLKEERTGYLRTAAVEEKKMPPDGHL